MSGALSMEVCPSEGHLLEKLLRVVQVVSPAGEPPPEPPEGFELVAMKHIKEDDSVEALLKPPDDEEDADGEGGRRVGFGKHEAKTYEQVLAEEPGYGAWLVKKVEREGKAGCRAANDFYTWVKPRLRYQGAGKKRRSCKWYFAAPSNEDEGSSVEKILSRWADFGNVASMPKLQSRLALLLSTAVPRTGIMPLKDISLIVTKSQPAPARGGSHEDGCGYISADLLRHFSNPAEGGTQDTQLIALQVRIVSPQAGLCKGILMVHPRLPDKTITINDTMVKAGPGSASGDGLMLVCQVHPTRANREMGRNLRAGAALPELRGPPISPMVRMLLSHLEVEDALLEAVHERGFVVGVGDPTQCIPRGHVFVTGLHHEDPHEVFVTRCPATKPADGQLFPRVELSQLQPRGDVTANMAAAFLHSLPFGALVFSSDGDISLPATVAAGDLDGDYYWVCWNLALVEAVARHRSQHPCPSLAAPQDQGHAPSADQSASRREGWLPRVQRHLKSKEVLHSGHAIGKAYRLWEEAATRDYGSLETQQLGELYVQAIDGKKHGSC